MPVFAPLMYTTTYLYDSRDGLTTTVNPDGTTEEYAYNCQGNVIQVTDERNNSTTYSYRAMNRKTGTTDALGDVVTYDYNADGDLTEDEEPTPAGQTARTTMYQYNNMNMLTVETDPLGFATYYGYDALGNRIGMNENGTQTWTLYDGSDPIMDFNSSGSLETRYLNVPTGQLVDSVLARESSGGTVTWYLPDRLGTVRDLINNSGAIIDHIDFSAFGTVLDQSNASERDRMMGFAGLERDTVTGLNLAVHRVQNPGTGRWPSQDPDGFTAEDTDLYRYTFNLPTALIDPTGLDVWIAGPSQIYDEPSGHLSISVGNPNGTYFSISFGFFGFGFNRQGLYGTVYQDTKPGGDFIEGYYYDTSPQVDAIIIARLQQLIAANRNKRYAYDITGLIDYNCRAWSFEQFDLIAKELKRNNKGRKAKPPKAFAGPDPINVPVE
jgi:RHS repeat-associated protein